MQSLFPHFNKSEFDSSLGDQTLTLLWPVLLHHWNKQTEGKHRLSCLTVQTADLVQTHINSRTRRLLTSSHCVHTLSWTNQGDLWRISLQLKPWKINSTLSLVCKEIQHAEYMRKLTAGKLQRNLHEKQHSYVICHVFVLVCIYIDTLVITFKNKLQKCMCLFTDEYKDRISMTLTWCY